MDKNDLQDLTLLHWMAIKKTSTPAEDDTD